MPEELVAVEVDAVQLHLDEREGDGPGAHMVHPHPHVRDRPVDEQPAHERERAGLGLCSGGARDRIARPVTELALGQPPHHEVADHEEGEDHGDDGEQLGSCAHDLRSGV